MKEQVTQVRSRESSQYASEYMEGIERVFLSSSSLLCTVFVSHIQVNIHSFI